MASRRVALHSAGGINVCKKGSQHSNSGKSQSKCHVQKIMSHRFVVRLLSVETMENSRIREEGLGSSFSGGPPKWAGGRIEHL